MKDFLVSLIVEILRWVFGETKPRMTQADRREELRKRLAEKIKEAGW